MDSAGAEGLKQETRRQDETQTPHCPEARYGRVVSAERGCFSYEISVIEAQTGHRVDSAAGGKA